MKLKDGFVLREIGGNHIVVPVGAQSVDFRCIITLNETGAFLWELLREEKSASDLVSALLNEYDVTEEIAAADVAGFTEKLRQAELLAE